MSSQRTITRAVSAPVRAREETGVVGAAPGSIVISFGTVAIIAGIEMNSERVVDPISRVERLQAMVRREADRVKRLIANDAPRVGKKKGKGKGQRLEIAAPPAEQIDHFTLQSVRTEKGQVLGQAYRRQPHFESLAKRDQGEALKAGRQSLIGTDELAALRYYRNAWEGCQRSEMRCALNQQPGGGRSGELPPSIALARSNLDRCEADIGPVLDVFRSIALHDRTYSQVAMERFGSRDQDWYDDKLGAFVSKPVPKSPRHSAIVKAEFLDGLGALVEATRGLVRTGE